MIGWCNVSSGRPYLWREWPCLGGNEQNLQRSGSNGAVRAGKR